MQYYILIITLLLALGWTLIAISEWMDGFSVSTVFASLCTLAQLTVLVVLAYALMFSDYHTREGDTWLALLSDIPLCFFLIFYWDGWQKVITEVGLGILLLLFGAMFLGGFSGGNTVDVWKRDVLFKSREDVEKVLGLRNLPPYQYSKAWMSDISTYVRFDYAEGYDSVAYEACLDSIMKVYPDYCGFRDRAELACFSTVWGKKERQFANVHFYKDCFVIGYGDVFHEDDLSINMRDSLKCRFPDNDIIAFYWEWCGPDYTWYAIYKLDRSMRQVDFHRLRDACAKDSDWEYTEKHDTIKMRQREPDRNGNNYQYEFTKDPNGKYSNVRVQYIDY